MVAFAGKMSSDVEKKSLNLMGVLRLCATPVRRLRGPVVGERRGAPLDGRPAPRTFFSCLAAPDWRPGGAALTVASQDACYLSQRQGAKFGLMSSQCYRTRSVRMKWLSSQPPTTVAPNVMSLNCLTMNLHDFLLRGSAIRSTTHDPDKGMSHRPLASA